MMSEGDDFYLQLLQSCQSADLNQRLDALEGLSKHRYLHLVPVQFWLDRLDAATSEQEQVALVRLMGRLEEPLPEEALEAMLDRLETFTLPLLGEVVSAMAVAQAEEMLNLLSWLLEDFAESSEDPARWEEDIPAEVLFALLAHPHPDVCLGALDVLSQLPAQSIPLEVVLPYRSHEQGAIREATLRTLSAAERQVPLEPVLAALRDPESGVRAVASHTCISLVGWLGEQFPLEPLVQALNDESDQVRENLLDALGKAPLRAPVEPVVAALTDSCTYVRCAAVETLGLIGQRVPPAIRAIVQAVSESDPDSRVRQRASATLLRIT